MGIHFSVLLLGPAFTGISWLDLSCLSCRFGFCPDRETRRFCRHSIDSVNVFCLLCENVMACNKWQRPQLGKQDTDREVSSLCSTLPGFKRR